MLRGCAHFSFTVSDLERSKRFYGDVLGLPLLYEMVHDHPYTAKQIGFPDAHLLVAAFGLSQRGAPDDGGRLELIEYREPRGVQLDTSTNNAGSAHLAFLVDDIHAEHARLSALGVTFRSAPVHIEAGVAKGGWTVYLRDPDEITLELVQPAATVAA